MKELSYNGYCLAFYIRRTRVVNQTGGRGKESQSLQGFKGFVYPEITRTGRREFLQKKRPLFIISPRERYQDATNEYIGILLNQEDGKINIAVVPTAANFWGGAINVRRRANARESRRIERRTQADD